MKETQIEWAKNPDGTQGYTWNPITGCLNGCSYCYARRLANTRLRERYMANKNWDTKTPDGYEGYPNLDPFYPRFWPERLEPGRKMPRNAGVFVCDMSDLFGIGVPYHWTKAVIDFILLRPDCRFYLLTKQPQNLLKFSPFPDNCWVGVSATNSDMFETAFRTLMRITARVKYVSFEPLLDWTRTEGLINPIKHLDWLIIGAQTKPYKPPQIEWVEEIKLAADKAGIPVFMKDNLKTLFQGKNLTLRQAMPK
uniref:DUF5131 family protein n=1 Tax=viral metagenome TaxID=1070528 RepID=A0A6M3JKS4_9ZZZZ